MLTKRRPAPPTVTAARPEPRNPRRGPRSTDAISCSVSGVAGALGSATHSARATIRRAEAGPVIAAEPIETRKSVCTHCSVGCTVIAKRAERRLGRARSRPSKARSISAPTAPRVPPCASSSPASGG